MPNLGSLVQVAGRVGVVRFPKLDGPTPVVDGDILAADFGDGALDRFVQIVPLPVGDQHISHLSHGKIFDTYTFFAHFFCSPPCIIASKNRKLSSYYAN